MKRWLSNAIAGVLGLAIGLVLLEVGVRVAGFTPPFTEANRRTATPAKRESRAGSSIPRAGATSNTRRPSRKASRAFS
jgi:hypothetical protein